MERGGRRYEGGRMTREEGLRRREEGYRMREKRGGRIQDEGKERERRKDTG